MTNVSVFADCSSKCAVIRVPFAVAAEMIDSLPLEYAEIRQELIDRSLRGRIGEFKTMMEEVANGSKKAHQ